MQTPTALTTGDQAPPANRPPLHRPTNRPTTAEQPANHTGQPRPANTFGRWLISATILTLAVRVILATIIAATQQQQATTTVETPTRPTLGHHAASPAPAEMDFDSSSLADTDAV